MFGFYQYDFEIYKDQFPKIENVMSERMLRNLK